MRRRMINLLVGKKVVSYVIAIIDGYHYRRFASMGLREPIERWYCREPKDPHGTVGIRVRIHSDDEAEIRHILNVVDIEHIHDRSDERLAEVKAANKIAARNR